MSIAIWVALAAPPESVVEQRSVDIDGDGRVERVVLTARVGADGNTRVASVALQRVDGPRVTVLASAEIGLEAGWEVSLGDQHVDLDGDGRLELAVDERIGGDGPRLWATTWWRFDGASKLSAVHYLTRRYAWRGRLEERSIEVRGGGRLVERVRFTEPQARSNQELELRWQPASGRFARVGYRVLE